MREIKHKKIRLFSDAEIKEDKEDVLDFQRYRDVITAIVRGTSGPFTIGILGSWGSGKTTLLRLVENSFYKDKDVVAVWFNAWQYEKEEDILFPFLATIIDGIENHNNSGEKSSFLAAKIGRVFGKKEKDFVTVLNNLRGILYGVSFNVGLVKFDTKEAIRRFDELQEIHVNTQLKKQGIYKKAFENLKIPNGKKIVVLIDDLDRCNPEKAVHILEAIKLLLNQPGFIFVLGMDDVVLEGYLEKKYIEEFGVEDKYFKDYNYLEKIIQLPFRIPSHERRMEKFISDLVKMSNISNVQSIIPLLDLVAKSNPRRAKRLVNTLVVDNALIQVCNQNTTKKKIEMEMLFVWRLVEYTSSTGMLALLLDNECIDFLKKYIGVTNHNIQLAAKGIPKFEELSRVMMDKIFREIFMSDLGQKWLVNEKGRDIAHTFYLEDRGGLEVISIESEKNLIKKKEIAEENKRVLGAKDSRTVKSIMDLADTYYFLGHYKEASDSYDEIIRVGAGDVIVYNNRGSAKVNLGFYEDAIVDFTKAIELDPDNVEAYNNRGSAKVNLGFYEDAIVDFTKAIELDPDNVEAYNNRGSAKANLRLYEDAIVDYDKAVELDPKNIETPPLVNLFNSPSIFEGLLPSIKLLSKEFSSQPIPSGHIGLNLKLIKETLYKFGVEVSLGEVKVGSMFTQYSIRPAVGVKLSKIMALKDDLAMALASYPIRIEAPIPGKSLVGIEIPNKSFSGVFLREMLESNNFIGLESPLSIALGKNVGGDMIFADLKNMPHMLIAGTAGSGKSVFINTIILSLLYQNSPDDLKMILVDSGQMELSLYNKIPHLLTDVITDNNKVINALRWVVGEMERRYKILQQAKSRDLDSYNKKYEAGESNEIIDPETGKLVKERLNKLPRIIIMIDELADLMASHSKEVEGVMIRIAQRARAIGIHLIVSTQTPDPTVITDLIKANITTRIAFKLATQMDSRAILDRVGAESLLGDGDMLYMTSLDSTPKRIRGAFVSEKEIQNVTNFWRRQTAIQEKGDESDTSSNMSLSFSDRNEPDDLIEEAKEIVVQQKKATTSLIQRRLRIGYSHAARIIDELETMGIIGPANGAKPREVLVGKSEGETEESSSKSEKMDQKKRDKWQI